MQAILLAGGLGTRLRSVVADCPKVMAEVAGRPFLEHLLLRMARQGVRRVVMAVGYRRECIIDYIGSRWQGLDLAYSVEEEPLGTGGAIKQALSMADRSPCFVFNADTWVDLDLAAMLGQHLATGERLSMAIRRLDDVSRFGALELRQGRVVGFLEKDRSGPGAINAGVYLLQGDIFDGLGLPQRFSIETDFLMPQVGTLRPLAFEVHGDFIDIGVPEDYRRAQELFSHRV